MKKKKDLYEKLALAMLGHLESEELEKIGHKHMNYIASELQKLDESNDYFYLQLEKVFGCSILQIPEALTEGDFQIQVSDKKTDLGVSYMDIANVLLLNMEYETLSNYDNDKHCSSIYHGLDCSPYIAHYLSSVISMEKELQEEWALADIVLDDVCVSDVYQTTALYFKAPKRLLGNNYPEAQSCEICIEFPTQLPQADFSSVMFSPTKVEDDTITDYDWYEKDMPANIVTRLIKKWQQA